MKKVLLGVLLVLSFIFPNISEAEDRDNVNILGTLDAVEKTTVHDVESKTGKIYLSPDSTAAVQINKANGTTNVLNVDTTNGYVGIGTMSPAFLLDMITPAADNVMRIRSSNAKGYSAIRFDASTGSTGLDERGAIGYGNSSGGYPGKVYIETTNLNVDAIPPDFIIVNTKWVDSAYTNSIKFTIKGDTTDGKALMTIAKNNMIGLDTLSGSDDGYLVIGASGADTRARGAKIVLSGVNRTGSGGMLELHAGDSGTGNIIQFITGNAARAVLDNTGRFGIGTKSPTAVLHLKAGTATASTAPLKFTAGTLLTIPESGAMEFDGTNFYLTSASTRKTIAFLDSSVSDERLKDIQGQFTGGLKAILAINPILYKYNKLSGLDTENVYVGFSVQNVIKYIPETVGKNKDGHYSLDDRPIIASLVNAIKELQAEIDELKMEKVMKRAGSAN